MKRIVSPFIILVAIISFISCNDNSIKKTSSDNYENLQLKCLSENSVDSVTLHDDKKFKSFLPFELLGNKDYLAIVYTIDLLKSNEPILYNTERKDYETYRIILSPSFEKPKIFRIETINNKTDLISSFYTTDSLASYLLFCKNIKAISDTQTLSKIKVLEFNNIIDSINFWKHKTYCAQENVFDGVTYFLEGRKKDQYKFIEMHNPKREQENEVIRLIKFCLENSKILKMELDFYVNFLKKSILVYKEKPCIRNFNNLIDASSRLEHHSYYDLYNTQSKFKSWNNDLSDIYREIFLNNNDETKKYILDNNLKDEIFEGADKSKLNKLLADFDKIYEEYDSIKDSQN